MRVADLVLEVLSAHGVRDIFGVPGDAINDITNALRKRDDMRFILVRHEEAGGLYGFCSGETLRPAGRLRRRNRLCSTSGSIRKSSSFRRESPSNRRRNLGWQR